MVRKDINDFYFIDVFAPYMVIDSKYNVETFYTLKEVALHLDVNVMSVYHYLENRFVSEISPFIKIEKIEYPYVFFYKGNRYECNRIEDIVTITGCSRAKIGQLITKFKKNNL